MTVPYENDVIAAIATPPGRGAVGIVRLSGSGSVGVVNRIFKKTGKDSRGCGNSFPSYLKSHRMYYGTISDNGTVIDEVMLCCMRVPRSFTREDVVEIYAHGGLVTMHGVLNAALKNGARLALPGEFTKRAFLNGRINLAQAEAVMDLVNAGSEAARAAGLRQLGGGLSGRVAACRDTILRWLAHIALSIDYPEHEEEALNRQTIISEGQALLADMRALLKTAEVGRVIREGIKTAIIGPPNAGKSTLLNAILGEDRAIVHESPGTTRDILTERVMVGDVPLVLIDTAGLRETEDPVEQMGLDKTYDAIKNAELVLYVVDGGGSSKDKTLGALPPIPRKLLKKFDQNFIVLINKCDLLPADEWKTMDEEIPISAKTGQGLDQLYDAIKRLFLSGMGDAGIKYFAESDIITRERHRALLCEAIEYLETALDDFGRGETEDIAAIPLRAAYLSLGHILGLEYADDIIDRIFAEFCVGK
ncbi:MAG: tRNA uridine-5-carboxymethylaminomethyl(34) synthesis GTPase MnmE [Defluviitaleaceae bacterium]|nr:tRNA uridine-5-carboxymethylaminomethyl(34) synthesis GTPase MnmE [Defluviitaleaceae bacterium]